MTGTLLNAATVVVAGVVGTAVGDRLPRRVRQTLLHGIGLAVVLIGLQSALTTQNVLLVLVSILLGGLLGELLDLDAALLRLGKAVERRLASQPDADPQAARGRDFSRGLVTASLVFCVGPMTILGSIQDGLTGDYRTLAVKSVLDGVAGLAFAASMGVGVAFSAIVVLVYQGALTLAAAGLRQLLTDPMIAEMTATGGLLVVAIGLVQLEVAQIRVANFLPALVFAPLGALVVGGQP